MDLIFVGGGEVRGCLTDFFPTRSLLSCCVVFSRPQFVGDDGGGGTVIHLSGRDGEDAISHLRGIQRRFSFRDD